MAIKRQNTRQPSARVARKREAARREILATAQDIMSESGAEAVTLASVAGRLGMTKQALYHYFPSKEALLRALVTELLDDEIETLIAAVESAKHDAKGLATLIRAFYKHYVSNLDAFRTIYCQLQLYTSEGSAINAATLRDEIHPRTGHLFDVLQERITGKGASAVERRRARQLAFSAWTSALGLVTMIGVAEATDDPLAHPHAALLKTLTGVFDQAVS